MAGSGLRGQDERDKWKQTGCARKMEENCWRQVFGAKIGAKSARNERTGFFLGFRGSIWHGKCTSNPWNLANGSAILAVGDAPKWALGGGVRSSGPR